MGLVPGPFVIEALPVLTSHGRELLRERIEVRTASRVDPEALINEAQGAVALIARVGDLPYRIGGEIFDCVPSVQVVSAIGSGADCYDVKAASDRGIPVLHNPGVAARPVVEYVLGAIVLLTRKLMDHSRYLCSGGEWSPRNRFAGQEVAECTLGVLGMGAIGAEVARRSQAAFDMHVIGFDPFATSERFQDLCVEQCDSLETLLTRSDVISLHLPLLPSTKGLIGSRELATMKRTASLINTSRGGIIDEAALTTALADGTIAAAAIDVFEDEPPDPMHPFFTMPNVFATPHCAGVSASGGARLAEATASNLLRALMGERPAHLVNPDVWPPRRGNPVLRPTLPR